MWGWGFELGSGKRKVKELLFVTKNKGLDLDYQLLGPTECGSFGNTNPARSHRSTAAWAGGPSTNGTISAEMRLTDRRGRRQFFFSDGRIVWSAIVGSAAL